MNILSNCKSYSTLKNNFISLSLERDPESQEGVFSNILAQKNRALVKNPLRKFMGNFVHGNQCSLFQQETNEKKNHFSFQLECLFSHIKSHGTYAPILKAFEKYNQILKNHKTNSNAEINLASQEFFKSLLNEIPLQMKSQANDCLKIIADSSTQLINAVELNGEEIKLFQQKYFNAIEKFVDLVFHKNGASISKEFKNIILSTSAYAGFLLTYEKRTPGDKSSILVKQSVFPVAYIFGALSGVFITTALAPILSPLIIFALGSISGYLISKCVEFISEKCLHTAEHHINEKIHQKKKELYSSFTGLENKILPLNKKFINFRETAKKPNEKITKLNLLQEIKGSPHHKFEDYSTAKEIIDRIKNEFDIKNISNTKLNLISEIKNLFQTLSPNEKILNEFYSLLHKATNLSEHKNAHFHQELKKKFIDIMNLMIPATFTQEEKFFILSCCFFSLNLRNFDVSFIRKSEPLVFALFDTLTDISGIATTCALQGLISTMPHATQFLVEFLATSAVGVVPAALGIATYFMLMKTCHLKDKKGIHLPNHFILNEVLNHKHHEKQELKETLAFAKNCLKNIYSPNTEHLRKQLDHLNSKENELFLIFKCQRNEQSEIILKTQFLQTMENLPEGYLFYPLIHHNFEQLEKELQNLTHEISQIEKKSLQLQ